MAWLLLLLLTGCDRRCAGVEMGEPCYEVASGRYAIFEPEAAGRGPVPALVWFHGYGGSAEKVLEREWFREALASRGVVGLVMDGVSNTWAHVGSPSDRRDEIAYLEEVLEDANGRLELDPDHLWVSGHSQGGSMAWDAACYAGGSFAAAFPVSGAFWEPLPDACPGAPLALRHTHGLADTTVPLEGRPIGSWRQGDVSTGIELWRQENGCGETPDREVREGPSTCQVWDRCDAGGDLWFCLHEGAHKVPPGWLERNLDWALSLQR